MSARPELKIELATPCAQKWEAMQGDFRKRFCASCTKNVYDLSGLTRSEIETLIARHEGRICVRFFQRADGTVLTADCPVGLAQKAARAARWARARLALAFASFIGAVLGGGALLDRDTLGPQPDAPVARLPRPWNAPPLPVEAKPPPVTGVIGVEHHYVNNMFFPDARQAYSMGVLKGISETSYKAR